MNTHIWTEKDISQGASLLLAGELVGLPTETVYGLAGNGLNPIAIEKIFQSKGRPSDNPLILHVASEEWIPRYCQNIPDKVWDLTKAFWPGALTLILEAKPCVPKEVTAGLATVGLRCPNHPLAQKLITESNVPLAAPSGNLSGKPSPTTAEAMREDMDGKISGIFDGGACSVGLESTILCLSPKPTILRIGGVSVEEIQLILGETVDISIHLSENQDKPLAPGMKYRHYAPQAPMTLVSGAQSAQWIASHIQVGDGVLCFQEYASLFSQHPRQVIGKEKDFSTQAQQVFSALRFFDQTPVQHIWSQCPEGEGMALAVASRLEKAAGFQIIHTEEK